jgi:hypothetical protein
MAQLMSFAAWRADVEGKTIGSGECVALANDYCARVLGVAPPATVGGAHDPYSSSMWEGLPADSPFTKVSPLAPMRAGDLPIWKYGSGVAPLSHVAIGVQDLGVAIRISTQNTNGHRYAETTNLPKAGLYGYLRLKNGAGGTVPVGYPDGLAGDLVEGAAGAVNGIGGVAGGLGQLAGVWGSILAKLSDPEFWKRMGVGLLGIILIMLVLTKIFSSSAAVSSAAGLIKKAH